MSRDSTIDRTSTGDSYGDAVRRAVDLHAEAARNHAAVRDVLAASLHADTAQPTVDAQLDDALASHAPDVRAEIDALDLTTFQALTAEREAAKALAEAGIIDDPRVSDDGDETALENAHDGVWDCPECSWCGRRARVEDSLRVVCPDCGGELEPAPDESA